MNKDIIDQIAIRRLLDVIGGDKEDLLDLIEEFEVLTPKIVEKMRTAATEENLDTLRISAHSLKSNGRDFGALSLATLCENLEHACKSGVVSDPAERVEEIGRALDIARKALKKTPLFDE